MNKRLYLLNGLAILGVVVNHAAGWGQIAMIQWAHRYLPVTSPDFSQVGSWAYYVLLIARQWSLFSVAAFLFTAGCFVAYADRGSQSKVGWKMVRTRIIGFLIPYLIWTAVIFIEQYITDNVAYSPLKYLWLVLTTGADGPYYYVPLICYLYLLSPFLTRLARKHPIWLLGISGVLQLGAQALHYLLLIFPANSVIHFLYKVTPDWSLPHWSLFFCVGLVLGYRMDWFKNWLAKSWRWFLAGVLVFGVLVVVGPEWIYRATGTDMRFVPLPYSAMLYAFAMIFLILSREVEKPWLQKPLSYLGGRTYGVYLIHFKAMEFAARIIYHVAPALLALQVPLMVFLIAWGLAVPLLFMSLVARTPARRYYRYLFG